MALGIGIALIRTDELVDAGSRVTCRRFSSRSQPSFGVRHKRRTPHRLANERQGGGPRSRPGSLGEKLLAHRPEVIARHHPCNQSERGRQNQDAGGDPRMSDRVATSRPPAA